MAERYRRLLERVHERAGDAFRVAIRYTADDWTILYLRDDLKTEEFRRTVGRTIARARDYTPISDSDWYDPLGDSQANVELYDAAAIIHFRDPSGGGGVLVSLDRDVAQGLGAFVDECTSLIYGSRD
ncbi:hypothetical protein [Salarchaeum japonicum]|uniref:Uncharacterized protein n=1 Tax=Salarchaeum japonicum TaxID=555573 RepID=A0AAV3SX23_9EURY|nr:hypothetical protein [Salarchaeum japonicum]